MVRESLDGSLRHLAEAGALVVATSALALLALAFAGELLRRAHRTPRLLAHLDRLVPHPARALAAGALALASALPVSTAAAADDSVRAFLGHAGSSSITTTTTAPVATKDSLEHHDTAPVPDPDVLGPPVAGAPAPSPEPPAPAAVPAPVAPTTTPGPEAVEQYAVVRGDCLWAIARRRLGAGATNQAVDAAWRAIYAANRDAIGDDPGLIHPGLVLSLPPLAPLP